MLRLAAEPLDVPTIRLFCDADTTAEHDLLIAIVDQLERRGFRLPAFLVADHALVAGPLALLAMPPSPSAHAAPGVRRAASASTSPARPTPPPGVTVIRGRGGPRRRGRRAPCSPNR